MIGKIRSKKSKPNFFLKERKIKKGCYYISDIEVSDVGGLKFHDCPRR